MAVQGPALLRAWLAERGVTVPELATRIGASRMSVWRWTQDGGPRPSGDWRQLLEYATGGAVPAAAWLDAAATTEAA